MSPLSEKFISDKAKELGDRYLDRRIYTLRLKALTPKEWLVLLLGVVYVVVICLVGVVDRNYRW